MASTRKHSIVLRKIPQGNYHCINIKCLSTSQGVEVLGYQVKVALGTLLLFYNMVIKTDDLVPARHIIISFFALCACF